MDISVVIPVLNESENVQPLLEELSAISRGFEGFEVCVIDDGSSDGTADRLREGQRTYAWLRVLRHDSPRGQSASMLEGMWSSRADVIVTMDGDRQNNPADIPAIVDALDGVDVVCGFRAKRKDSASRRCASRIANRVRNWVTRDGIRDTGCSLKAFRRECVADLPLLDGVHRFMPAYFNIAGRHLLEVPVDHRARVAGVSKYTNFERLPRTILDLIGFWWFRRRHVPLRFDVDAELPHG